MIMVNKDYRVFNNPLEYIECLNYDLEGDILPRDVKEFPAYAVYDDCMGQWRMVDYDTFVRYIEVMRDEMREEIEDINWYLDAKCDDVN